MTTQIKVLRENLVKQLSSLEEDNVGIAGIEFSRKQLLSALKLQKDADTLTMSYGLVSWHYDYEHRHPESGWLYKDGTIRNWESEGSVKVDYPARWEYAPYTRESTPCIQFEMTANGVHQIMRFCHSPVNTRNGNGSTKHLNFVDYKETPAPKQELTGIAIDTRELIRALEFAVKSSAPDESRPILCCVLFDCGNDTLKVVAADGFRLPVATLPAPGIAADQILIHQKDIARLIKFLKGTITGRGKNKCYPDTYLSCNQDNNTVKFASESGSVTYPRFDGTFPNYSQLVPTDGVKIEFIASELLNAVKPLANIARESSGIIRLEFKTSDNVGKVRVSARSEEHQSANEIDANVPDNDHRIALNGKYLTDVLSHMGDNMVTLKLTTPSSPMVFESETFQETIMPMFVQFDSEEPTPAPKVQPQPEDIEESEPVLTVEDNEHLSEHDRQTVEV